MLRAEAIAKRASFMNAADNGLQWELMKINPTADLVCNLRQTAYCSSYCNYA
jgi:hypothetical protein